MRKMPRSYRMSSASGVVGPLAASAMIFALMLPALRAVIWFSSAAGTRMSHSVSRSSAFVISSAPGKPLTVPCSFFQRDDPVDVEPAHVADAAGRVGDRDDRRALVADELGGDRAGVAEALDRDRRALAGPCRGARPPRRSCRRSRGPSPRCGPRSRRAQIGLPVTTPGTV